MSPAVVYIVLWIRIRRLYETVNHSLTNTQVLSWSPVEVVRSARSANNIGAFVKQVAGTESASRAPSGRPKNMDGYMTYHRPAHLMKPVTDKWAHSVPQGQHKPAITTMLVDLLEDPDASAEPIRFGARLGRNQLRRYLSDLEAAGIAHVALNFRPSSRPVEEALEEIAEHVLPAFSGHPQIPTQIRAAGGRLVRGIRSASS